MEKSNIIISIIIVLCIAAAVAAYGITNSNNPIFSDLSSINGNNGNGLGNNSTLNATNQSTATTTGSSSSDSGSSDDGSSYSGSDSGSSGSDYSSSSSGSSSSSSGSSGQQLSRSDAQSIADDTVDEEGCYAGSVSYSDGYWHCNIYDSSGNSVDSISINDATGSVSEG